MSAPLVEPIPLNPSDPFSPVQFAGPPPTVDPTYLARGHYERTLILNRLFKLLVEIITSLQNAAKAQSNRLTFLTQWQKAYTDLMNAVHTFSKNNGDALSSEDDAVRQEVNNTNSTYITRLQNSRSVISDDAKALQSNVNQSVDAVNQQSNLATSILQQMSTILSTIFK